MQKVLCLVCSNASKWPKALRVFCLKPELLWFTMWRPPVSKWVAVSPMLWLEELITCAWKHTRDHSPWFSLVVAQTHQKYLNNYYMDCHEILYKLSRSGKNGSLLWWSPDFSCSSTSSLKFPIWPLIHVIPISTDYSLSILGQCYSCSSLI